MYNYYYGFRIKDKLVESGHKIRITKLDGNSNLAYLFRKEIIDEATILFLKHEKYNTLMMTFELKKNGKPITNAERFEYSQITIEDMPERAKKEFVCEPCEINISFAEELELSTAEFI